MYEEVCEAAQPTYGGGRGGAGGASGGYGAAKAPACRQVFVHFPFLAREIEYGEVSDQGYISVPKLGESESDLMMPEK